MSLLLSIATLSILYWLIGYWSRKAKKEAKYPSATIRRIDEVTLDETEREISD